MRIYVEDYTIDPECKYVVTTRRQFYSSEGIFTVDKNHIYKLEITDVPKEIVNGRIIDNSKFNKRIVNQMPFDAIEVNTVVTKYTNGLVVEKINDTMSDYYYVKQ